MERGEEEVTRRDEEEEGEEVKRGRAIEDERGLYRAAPMGLVKAFVSDVKRSSSSRGSFSRAVPLVGDKTCERNRKSLRRRRRGA